MSIFPPDTNPLPARPRKPVIEQLLVIAGSMALAALWMWMCIPPVGRNPWIFLGISCLIWIVASLWLRQRRWSRNHEYGSSYFAQATLWLGAISALLLPILLGGLALFPAVAGIITGLIELVREFRSRSSHNPGNILGLLLCAGTIVFLLS